MTREEAITIIDNLHLIGCGRNQHEDDLKINIALDMAIEALQADTVSREFYEDAVKANHGLAKENSELKAQLKSAKAVQGEWITDRNPTEYGAYIVTIADEDGGFVCELQYGEPLMPICKVNGACWYDADDEFGDCPYYDIIAWMPLPKPYKEESEV